jgi:uncharacterized protein YdiU (UPF0061 family)
MVHFDNSYLQLPTRFYTKLEPTPVPLPGPIRVNHALAQNLGIDDEWLKGIPTTRALAAVTTGEQVFRPGVASGPLPGAVLTRVAQSHIRIGTFQYFLARQDTEAQRRPAW